MTLTKAELADMLFEKVGLNKREAKDMVETFFEGLDFRRFQVDLDEEIAMDDPGAFSRLTHYGDRMASRLLRDQFDSAMGVQPQQLR